MQKWQQWESASEADWGLAVEREAVIRPLAAQKRLCTDDVEEAARHLGVVRSVLYKLVRRYRQRPQTSSLLPFKRGRDTHTTVLEKKSFDATYVSAVISGYLVNAQSSIVRAQLGTAYRLAAKEA